MLKTFCIGAAVVVGIAAELNGLFMLISPGQWYFAIPGVTTTGPFNQHFVRDIGLIYLVVGTSLLVGAARPRFRLILWAVPTLWLCAHALVHFWEVAVGISEHSAMARDFPDVTVPAIIGVVLTLWAASAHTSRTEQDAKTPASDAGRWR